MATLLATALLAGGCGSGGSTPTLKTTPIAKAIAKSFLDQRHIYTKVHCPHDVPQQKGHGFECTAILDVGRYPVSVDQTNDQGHVTWGSKKPLTVLNVARIRSAIRRTVLKTKHVRAHVDCPSMILQKQGLTFSCFATVAAGEATAKIKAGRYTLTVTETDDAGHVKYAGH